MGPPEDDIAAGDAEGEWMIHQGDRQDGPFTTEQVRAMRDQGRLAPTTWVWREGMATWVPLSTIPFPPAVPAPPAPAAAPYRAGPQAPSPLYAGPRSAPPARPGPKPGRKRRKRNRRMASLYFLGLGGVLCLPFFADYVVGGMIPVWVLGVVVIALGLLGLCGVNVFHGGPLDRRNDP